MPHYLPGPAVIGSGVGMAIASVSSVLLEFTLALHYLLIPQNDFHEMVSGFHLKKPGCVFFMPKRDNVSGCLPDAV